MGRRDKKTEDNLAFEVIIRNTVTSGAQSSIQTVSDPPSDCPGQCGQSDLGSSLRTSACDILLW